MRFINIRRQMVSVVVTNLILLGAVTAAHAGTWQVTVASSSSAPTLTAASPAIGVANNPQTSAVASVSVAGTASSPVSASASSSYSGTWTFTWVPANGTDWPTAYDIKQVTTQQYSAILINGSGSAQVDTCSITLPGSPVAQGDGQTVATNSTPSSGDPNLTISISQMNEPQYDRAITGGWASDKQTTTITDRVYAAPYFPAHFATPSAIVLNFSVSSATPTARITNYTSTSTSGGISALFVANDFFTGQ